MDNLPFRTFRAQKAALTRAIRSEDPSRVEYECRRVVGRDWTPESPHTPHWPDDWRRWLRALEDMGGTPRLLDEVFQGAL